MMRFMVTSRFQIHSVKLPCNHAVISITDPLSPPVVLPEDPLRVGMLRLEFYDVDRAFDGMSDRVRNKMFTFKEADVILEFVKKFIGQDIVIVCQCEAGISRSAAVAAALSRIHNEQDSNYFAMFHPNRRVYALLLTRFYCAPEKDGSKSMTPMMSVDDDYLPPMIIKL